MFKNFKNSKIIIIIAFISLIPLSINVLNEINLKSSKETISENINKETKYVYPVGKIVGLKATTDGVLVVGYEEDKVEYIGGIQKGDNIIKINNTKIENSEDVENVLKKVVGDEVQITFERNNKYITETIKVKKDNGNIKLGLWVRDKISGMGTVTCYDPSNLKFSAVGHAITDVDTNEFLKIKQGYIYSPSNIEIIKATDSKVGYIEGKFDKYNSIGKFNNNSNFGISGNMTSKLNSKVDLVEVGKRKDVKLGNASILFEDENRNIRSYDICIKSFVEDDKNDRNMIIEVIDNDLINYTGGIIQGMSGAPILQNNKIVGAITHVFKDNPKKGYGVFIDEMIELDNRY